MALCFKSTVPAVARTAAQPAPTHWLCIAPRQPDGAPQGPACQPIQCAQERGVCVHACTCIVYKCVYIRAYLCRKKKNRQVSNGRIVFEQPQAASVPRHRQSPCRTGNKSAATVLGRPRSPHTDIDPVVLRSYSEAEKSMANICTV
jgi:hypothetical protein